MENPFDSGHIRNYILLYVSVVVIMILFFIATTLFHTKENIKTKKFDTNISKKIEQKQKEQTPKNNLKIINISY